MYLLRLLGGCDLAGADGPDGFVRDHHLAPVLDLLRDRLQLANDDVIGLARLALLKRLAAAENDGQAGGQSVGGLGGDERVALREDGAAFRVAEDGPRDARVEKLRGGDLAREGTVGSIKDVLCRDFKAGTEVLAGEEEVEGRRSDDDFGLVRELGVVQMRDNVLDLGDGAVPGCR